MVLVLMKVQLWRTETDGHPEHLGKKGFIVFVGPDTHVLTQEHFWAGGGSRDCVPLSLLFCSVSRELGTCFVLPRLLLCFLLLCIPGLLWVRLLARFSLPCACAASIPPPASFVCAPAAFASASGSFLPCLFSSDDLIGLIGHLTEWLL